MCFLFTCKLNNVLPDSFPNASFFSIHKCMVSSQGGSGYAGYNMFFTEICGYVKVFSLGTQLLLGAMYALTPIIFTDMQLCKKSVKIIMQYAIMQK